MLGRVLSAPLDLDLPPWELHVVTGVRGAHDLPDEAVIVCLKVHHSAGDGLALPALPGGPIGVFDPPPRSHETLPRRLSSAAGYAGTCSAGALGPPPPPPPPPSACAPPPGFPAFAKSSSQEVSCALCDCWPTRNTFVRRKKNETEKVSKGNA